jgi:hypothetical protein
MQKQLRTGVEEMMKNAEVRDRYSEVVSPLVGWGTQVRR